MDGIQQINIDGKLWPAVVPLNTKNPFKAAVFAGSKLGLVDTISLYLGKPQEPFHESTELDDSFVYSNILPIRKRDVMLVAPPKTGTTLMQQLCHQIKTRGGEESMNFEHINDVSPWLDFVLANGQDIESLNDPRIFKTHRLLSDSRRGCKYIATIRNPEDTTKSFYEFLKDFQRPVIQHCKSPSELVLKTDYLTRKPYGGTLWDYFNEFWQAKEMDDLLVIPYEFLTYNLETVAQIVASFIGEPALSQTELENVTRKCNKEFMGSSEHISQFNCVLKNDNDDGEVVARTVNLDKKPELTEEAKAALSKKWESEVFSTTGMRSYNEFANHFKEKLLSRKS